MFEDTGDNTTKNTRLEVTENPQLFPPGIISHVYQLTVPVDITIVEYCRTLWSNKFFWLIHTPQIQNLIIPYLCILNWGNTTSYQSLMPFNCHWKRENPGWDKIPKIKRGIPYLKPVNSLGKVRHVTIIIGIWISWIQIKPNIIYQNGIFWGYGIENHSWIYPTTPTPTQTWIATIILN